MKKIVFLLIVLFCFFLIACKEKQDNEELNSESIDDKINLENKNNLDNNQEKNRGDNTKIQDVGITNQAQEENTERINIGKFYSLQEAHELGILSLDDLEKIIDINHGDIEFNEEIDIEGENKIKSTRLYNLLNNYNCEDAKMDDISIVKYYGNYNGAYVISFTDIYSLPIGFSERSVAVIVSLNPPRINYFKYYGEYPIVVWSEKVYE